MVRHHAWKFGILAHGNFPFPSDMRECSVVTFVVVGEKPILNKSNTIGCAPSGKDLWICFGGVAGAFRNTTLLFKDEALRFTYTANEKQASKKGRVGWGAGADSERRRQVLSLFSICHLIVFCLGLLSFGSSRDGFLVTVRCVLLC